VENYKLEEVNLNIPLWLVQEEDYIPHTDKDTFLNKSIISILKILSRIKTQDQTNTGTHKINVTLKVGFTFLMLLLLSFSKSFVFLSIIAVVILLILSSMDGKTITSILKITLIMTGFTFLVLLPATVWGNSYSGIMLTTKVFITVTAVNIISHTTRWSQITGALKRLFIPDILILVLDITIKYIVMLGDFALNMLYALKLRSVGKNRNKYTSLSGVAGTMFIKSKEMSEDMYNAMECRGFTGEYHVHNSFKITIYDCIYIVLNLAVVVLFVYFQSV